MNIDKENAAKSPVLGLFGGTFNPIHNAHIEVAKKALKQFGLSKVIFIPAKIPPHKMDEPMPDANLRFQMVKLAVEDHPNFEVSKVEVDREAPSYTIDTVKEMKRRHSGKLYFIIGSDALADIRTWKSPRELLETCSFIVAPRKGIGPEYFRKDYYRGADIHFLEMSEIHISSSQIREMFKKNLSLDTLVPEKTKKFIREKGIYA